VLGTASANDFDIQLRPGIDPELYRTLAKTTVPQVGSITDSAALGTRTLISPNWVLTAGHVTRGEPAKTFTTAGGITRTFDTSAAGRVEFGFLDVGLMRLSSPITEIAPMKLYSIAKYGVESGAIGNSVLFGGAGNGGDGNTGQNGDHPLKGVPLVAQTRVTGVDTANYIQTVFRTPADGALPLEGGVAQGDSGGGIYFNVNGEWAIAGVLSYAGAEGDSSNIGKFGSSGGYAPTGAGGALDFILTHATDAQIVPEPASLGVLVTASLLALRRRRARC